MTDEPIDIVGPEGPQNIVDIPRGINGPDGGIEPTMDIEGMGPDEDSRD